MELVNSNKRYQKIIAGILGIAILSIITALILGFGDFLVYRDDCYYPIDLGLDQDNTGNKNIVTIAQRRTFEGIDTEKGVIDIIKYDLPTKVPVCISDDTVKDWLIQINVTGGYMPYDGYVKLYQDKQSTCPIGTMKLVWTPDESGCCWQSYNVTFDVCGPCIHVDSNHFPWSGTDPNGWILEEKAPNQDYTLGKEVDIKIVTKWKGCDDDYQKFEIILSHKDVSGVPNSRVIIAS